MDFKAVYQDDIIDQFKEETGVEEVVFETYIPLNTERHVDLAP